MLSLLSAISAMDSSRPKEKCNAYASRRIPRGEMAQPAGSALETGVKPYTAIHQPSTLQFCRSEVKSMVGKSKVVTVRSLRRVRMVRMLQYNEARSK